MGEPEWVGRLRKHLSSNSRRPPYGGNCVFAGSSQYNGEHLAQQRSAAEPSRHSTHWFRHPATQALNSATRLRIHEHTGAGMPRMPLNLPWSAQERHKTGSAPDTGFRFHRSSRHSVPTSAGQQIPSRYSTAFRLALGYHCTGTCALVFRVQRIRMSGTLRQSPTQESPLMLSRHEERLHQRARLDSGMKLTRLMVRTRI